MALTVEILARAPLDAALWGLDEKTLTRAVVRAANRTLTGTRKEVSVGVRKRVNLKAKTIKDEMVYRKASMARPAAQVRVPYEPISLKRYGARQVKSGLSVRVLKSAGRSKIKSGFKSKEMRDHAFLRVGKERLPLRKLFGPTLQSQVEIVMPSLQIDYIDPTFEKRLEEQIAWEIEKARRKALRQVGKG